MRILFKIFSINNTKKQIKKSVILEGLILGLIGIPIGILCGFIAVFILGMLIREIDHEFHDLEVSHLSDLKDYEYND